MIASNVWIVAEQKRGLLERVSFELITRGLELSEKTGTPLSVMLFGDNVSGEECNRLIRCGAKQVVYVEDPGLSEFLIEPYARCMKHVIDTYSPKIVLAGATTTGRSLLPYVAVKTNTGLTADCTLLDIDPETKKLLQTRPAIGGNIMATIKTPNHLPQMATVRPRSTKPAKDIGNTEGKIIKIHPDFSLNSRIRIKDFIPNEDEISLADAETIVSVGKGIKKKDNLPIIYELAEVLHAAVGASRDVIDRGWLSYPHQVGLSGQTVSPKLYIAIGLSGTIQHLAGMQTSEKIIAVNIDPQAMIYKIADYGIVGDLFEVVPRLTEKLRSAHPGI